MNKTELYAEAQRRLTAIYGDNKISKKAQEALETMIDDLLKPKAGGKIGQQPKEIDGVMYYHCRYYNDFYPEAEMVMSKGKSKGYTKLAIGVWNKARRQVKVLQDQQGTLVDQELYEDAKALGAHINQLKENLNKPEFFRDEENNTITVETLTFD